MSNNQVATALSLEPTEVGTDAKLALEAMKAAHDAWRSDPTHERLYFDMGFETKRFKFLDAELIGFEELMKYYPSVESDLSARGIVLEQYEILAAWISARKDFRRVHHISTRANLMRYVMHSQHPMLPASIRHSMEYPANAETIVNQILGRNSILPRWQANFTSAT